MEDLKYKLQAGEVKFSFTKTNGDVRYAVGTTNVDLIPDSGKLLKEDAHKITDNPDVIKFFDLENNGWRSLRKESFLKYE
jgi:hypothetical protein